MTDITSTRLGLRAMEFETGLASNVDPASPELIDYDVTRTIGRAARLAMLLRGQDVIEDEQKLRRLAAAELKIAPAEYTQVKRALLEADLLEEKTIQGKHVLYERVQRLDYGSNYKRLGDLWAASSERTEKELALLHTLDQVIQVPQAPDAIDALSGLNAHDRNAVVEVGTSAAVFEILSVNKDEKALYSPLLWDVSPQKLARFLRHCDKNRLMDLLGQVRRTAGVALLKPGAADPLVQQAVSAGILPSYDVTSAGGKRVYSFAPYVGSLLTSDEEKTILDKARAIVSCLRYGSEAAQITRIASPVAVLNALMNPERNYQIGPHTELKNQYGMLLTKQIARIIKDDNSRFYVRLIKSRDNLRACEIAKELLLTGEVLSEKEPSGAESLSLVMKGEIGNPLKQVNIAKQKRPARADELADLIDTLRRT